MTLYMGGDSPGFFDFIPQAFVAQLPGIRVNTITDLSKDHDARIDNQLATDTLVADVAILQTTRAAVERFKSQVELYVGAPQGPNPADPKNTLGRAPGRF